MRVRYAIAAGLVVGLSIMSNRSDAHAADPGHYCTPSGTRLNENDFTQVQQQQFNRAERKVWSPKSTKPVVETAAATIARLRIRQEANRMTKVLCSSRSGEQSAAGRGIGIGTSIQLGLLGAAIVGGLVKFGGMVATAKGDRDNVNQQRRSDREIAALQAQLQEERSIRRANERL